MQSNRLINFDAWVSFAFDSRMRYFFNLTSHFEGQYPDSMIPSGNFVVYLPKYSTTDLDSKRFFGKNNLFAP
jgi:hypothetical protein